jgi:hypothetical protein
VRLHRKLTVSAAALSMAVAMGMTAGGVATAEPNTVPNGPWVNDSQRVKLERLHTYDELTDALHRLERRSQGTLELSSGSDRKARSLFERSLHAPTDSEI